MANGSPNPLHVRTANQKPTPHTSALTHMTGLDEDLERALGEQMRK